MAFQLQNKRCRDLGSWIPMSASSTLKFRRPCPLEIFLIAFPSIGPEEFWHIPKVQLKCPLFFVKSSAVTLFSVLPQYFVKHVNYNLNLLFACITNHTIVGTETVFYSILFLTASIENILGPPHTNECHKQDHPKVPRAITVFKKSQDQLKQLENQSDPNHGDVQPLPS